MAKKSKAEAMSKMQAMVNDLAGKGKDVLRVSSAVFNAVKTMIGAEVDKAEAMAGIAELHKDWEEKGLNKKAVKIIVSFSKMNDAKKSDFLRTLLPGLEAHLPTQLDIFADTAPKTDEGDSAVEIADGAGAPAGATIQ